MARAAPQFGLVFDRDGVRNHVAKLPIITPAGEEVTEPFNFVVAVDQKQQVALFHCPYSADMAMLHCDPFNKELLKPWRKHIKSVKYVDTPANVCLAYLAPGAGAGLASILELLEACSAEGCSLDLRLVFKWRLSMMAAVLQLLFNSSSSSSSSSSSNSLNKLLAGCLQQVHRGPGPMLFISSTYFKHMDTLAAAAKPDACLLLTDHETELWKTELYGHLQQHPCASALVTKLKLGAEDNMERVVYGVATLAEQQQQYQQQDAVEPGTKQKKDSPVEREENWDINPVHKKAQQAAVAGGSSAEHSAEHAADGCMAGQKPQQLLQLLQQEQQQQEQEQQHQGQQQRRALQLHPDDFARGLFVLPPEEADHMVEEALLVLDSNATIALLQPDKEINTSRNLGNLGNHDEKQYEMYLAVRPNIPQQMQHLKDSSLNTVQKYNKLPSLRTKAGGFQLVQSARPHEFVRACNTPGPTVMCVISSHLMRRAPHDAAQQQQQCHMLPGGELRKWQAANSAARWAAARLVAAAHVAWALQNNPGALKGLAIAGLKPLPAEASQCSSSMKQGVSAVAHMLSGAAVQQRGGGCE
ncbi:hypothetical protein OEZ85_001960 [Tetradesmus obliquus]|uniref:Uncharacterized protein n=1 Tax=Tetradesmus obliquus TaxID=3088 RepID=A0ABY8U4B0_TETOB|nr:hypothetical protein OEZ85_001960 [Tetradesmus obliquus]